MIKNLKIKTHPKDAGFYPAEDLPEYLETLKKHNKESKRIQRQDIKPGQVLIVLEGKFASNRVILVSQTNDYKAICIGYSESKIPLFIIDERFLFATSVFIKFDEKVIAENIKESKMGESEEEEFKVCDLSNKIYESVDKEVAKVKGMKRYMCTPFCVPEGKDIYAMNF